MKLLRWSRGASLALLALAGTPLAQKQAAATLHHYQMFLLPYDVYGQDVSDRGKVVAQNGPAQSSFTWRRTIGLQPLPPLPGLPWASASSGNRAGFVVGMSRDYTQTVPTLWSPGAIPTPIPGSPGGQAIAINDAGVVVGVGYVGSTPTPWVWDAGNGMRPLSGFGLPAGYFPRDLSDSGFVVGGGPSQQAFRLDLSTSTFKSLGALGVYSGAFSVNEQGHVVGWTSDITDTRPFVWTPEKGMRFLGPLMPSFLFLDTGWAWSINDHDTVVGEIEVQTDFYHAFLWDDLNGMRDLNALVQGRGPIELTRARHISDTGWITGDAIDHSAGDTPLGFVLQPR